MSAPSCLASTWTTLSPNRRRRLARMVIWSLAAAAVLAELSFLAVQRLA